MRKYLGRADTDWLLEDNPSDALQQRGCGQGAIIRPVVQEARQDGFGVKVCNCGLLSLRDELVEIRES